MGVIGRGSRISRWRGRASILFCGVAFFGAALGASAETLPQPPANCDIAFRVLPSAFGSTGLDAETLDEQPLVRVIGELGSRYLGFSPLRDLDQAFDGTLVGGILSRPKGGPTLTDFIKDGELRGGRAQMVAEIQTLVDDLEAYHAENETYPTDFKKYIDEVRYYEPYFAPGIAYKYEPLGGGKRYRITVTYSAPSELAKLGPAPVFESGEPVRNLEPATAPIPLNFVLAARVKDQAKAREISDKLFGSAQGGFWTSPDDPSMVATLRGSWWIVSDGRENFGPFLKSLNGEAPGLSKNLQYQSVARNIDLDQAVMVYADLPKILDGVIPADDLESRKALKVLGPAGYALRPYEHAQMRMQAFVGINAPKGTALAKFFLDSKDANPGASMISDNIPWDVSNVFAIDYQATKQLLDATIALSPTLHENIDMVEDVWAGLLGIDAEAGFDRLAKGWVIFSFERLDIFVNAFESFSEALGSGPAADPEETTVDPEMEVEEAVTTATIDVPTSAPEETDPELAPDPSETVVVTVDPDEPETDLVPSPLPPIDDGPPKPPRFPFTVAFAIPDTLSRDALVEAIEKRMGDGPVSSEMSGVKVSSREDGLLSYALRDEWVYVSGGHTQRLMRNLLEAATGRKERLTSIASWNRFREGQKGRVLVMGHQKVDAFYSVLKGALLFLGPDFRPLAREVGGLRDYHSAVFAVPDGVLAVGDILQGDGR